MEKIIHYIYHIPGVKIGATKRPQDRVTEQGYNTYEILEKSDDVYYISKREKELQKQYGYKIDGPYYWQTLNAATLEGRSTGGQKNVENGTGIFGMSEEEKFKRSSKVGKNNVENGTGWFGMSEEEKFKRNSKACKGKLWINSGEINKRIKPQDLKHFIQQGFTLGMKK